MKASHIYSPDMQEKIRQKTTVVSKLVLLLMLSGLIVPAASSASTTFDKCMINSAFGSYSERQFLEADFLLSGGPDAVLISENRFLKYSSCIDTEKYTAGIDETAEKALQDIKEKGLLYPEGPVIAFGHDLKAICAGIDYREKNCRDEIEAVYRIVKNTAEKSGRKIPGVLFCRDHIPYLS